MYCESCGAQLPPNEKVCPYCGTLAPAYYADSGASPHELTQPSASTPAFTPSLPPPPSTSYGSNPYKTASQNPYEASPYISSSPPRPPRKVSPLLLIALAGLIVLIGGAGVGFALLRNNQTSTHVPPPKGSTPITGATSVASATATANTFYSMYDTDTSHQPTIDDPLSDNSKGLQWNTGQGCTFSGGGLHVSNTQSSGAIACMARNSSFNNFLCQVQMTIIKGSYGSLIFRSDGSLSNFYIFREGQDGVLTFAKYQNGVDDEIEHTPVLAFKQGPNQTNLLAVIAQGSHLIFYINAQYVYDTYDTSFSGGEIGLVAGSIGAPTEVVYNNLKIWQL